MNDTQIITVTITPVRRSQADIDRYGKGSGAEHQASILSVGNLDERTHLSAEIVRRISEALHPINIPTTQFGPQKETGTWDGGDPGNALDPDASYA